MTRSPAAQVARSIANGELLPLGTNTRRVLRYLRDRDDIAHNGGTVADVPQRSRAMRPAVCCQKVRKRRSVSDFVGIFGFEPVGSKSRNRPKMTWRLILEIDTPSFAASSSWVQFDR
jgi:hypothetical protein